MRRIMDKDIRIRKPRKCFGCLVMMLRGDLAHVQTNAEDGKIYSLTICEDCEDIVRKMHSDDEFQEGDLAEQALKG